MSNEDITRIEQVINTYVESYLHADIEGLQSVFAHDAIMNGYVGDRLIEGTPEIFIVNVSKAPAIASSDLTPSYEIGQVEIQGNAASVTIQEYGFGAFNFTDFIHLLRRDGDWKIVSKTFSTF